MKSLLALAAAVSLTSFPARAQPLSDRSLPAVEPPPLSLVSDEAREPPVLAVPATLPRLGADLALAIYQDSIAAQREKLADYTAETVVVAELPDTRQHGEFQLERFYSAPATLKFKAVRFTGDGFVKSNVINRFLSSEVKRVEKREGPRTAIDAANYVFLYLGNEEIEGQPVHTYRVTPRREDKGLFRGKISIDAFHGRLRRAAGTLTKKPSWFVKKIEFVEDYADFEGFTFPVRLHSVAAMRLVGRVVLDVEIREYRPNAASAPAPPTMPAAPPGGGR